MKRIVFAVVDKNTGRAFCYCDTLKELASIGTCTDNACIMCLTWESYLKRYNA